MSKKILGPKIWDQKYLVQRIKVKKIKASKILGQTKFLKKKNWSNGWMSPGQILFGQMSLLQLETVLDGPRKVFFQKNFGLKNIWIKKKFGSKKIWSKKI